jgi:hypothetical protein
MRTQQPLPLDQRGYAAFRQGLADLMRHDPELLDLDAARAFLRDNRVFLGELTALEFEEAPDEPLRVMIHYMVLGASDLGAYHEASRSWLAGRGFALPPWDPGTSRSASRLIPYRGKVAAVVEWQPQRALTVDPALDERSQRWVLAMAIGAGERPQWNDQEIKRYAAYLTMGEEFAADRELSDEALADKYDVPVDAVQYRRRLSDAVTPEEHG